ncbi:hypothetical protein FQZ97_1010190 [compost metagenome]
MKNPTMNELTKYFIRRLEEQFSAYIDPDESPEQFAADVRTRLDADMCSELIDESGQRQINDDIWMAALDEIDQLAYEFAMNFEEEETADS